MNHTHTNTCRYTSFSAGAHFKSSVWPYPGFEVSGADNYNSDWAALRCPQLDDGADNNFYQATWDYVQDTRAGMAKWGDIRWWDTSAVLTMANAFSAHRDEQGLYVKDGNPKASVFTTDSLPWNTAKVNQMTGFLSGATAFNADVSAFDTSRVTSMSQVFQDAHNFDGTSI